MEQNMSHTEEVEEKAEDSLLKEMHKDRGKRAHETLKRRLGQEAYRSHMENIGAKGGKAYVKKGFAVSHKQLERFKHESN